MFIQKGNVIKLYATKEEKEKRAKKQENADESDTESDMSDASDEESEDQNEKKGKAIIKRMTLSKVVTQNNNSAIAKTFTYDKADVLMLIDKNSVRYYKGIDVAKILEYINTKRALTRNVKPEYKKRYADIGTFTTLKNMKPQTIFVTDRGLMQLIAKSTKPSAIDLLEYIANEILPTLFTTGTFTLPTKEKDIERLQKDFYDENMLSDWHNKNCVYLAYIGCHSGNHILKFGISCDFVRRELVEHRAFYKTFNVIKIWESLANKTVEDKLKTNFSSKNMLTTLRIKGNNGKILQKRELVRLNEVNGLNYCLNMIDSVVKKTITPHETELHEQIKELKHEKEKELMEQKIKHLEEKYNILEKLNTQIEDSNAQLKDANTQLKDTNAQLKEKLKKLQKPKISTPKVSIPNKKNQRNIKNHNK